MLKNYFKTALRNIKRNKAYSFINIMGLSIGMACFIFIAIYIKYELSYDKFHKNNNQIFRVDLKADYTNAGSDIYNKTPAPLAEVLKSDFPGINYVTRLREESRLPLIKAGENSFLEDKFFYTDPEFLEMFSFPLVFGDPKTALSEPYTIIITEAIALKYFGNENPIGRTITLDQKRQQQPYIITGVIKDAPANSHIKFNFLASFSTLYAQQNSKFQSHSLHWNAAGFYTYIELKKNTSPKDLNEKLIDVVKKYKGQNSKIRFVLEPVERIHLYQNWDKDIEANGDIRYVYLFAAIGFFILLIACFNYVNISTAQSVKRTKEVGLRKVVGANRNQLLKQFLGESLVYSFISFCLAIIIVELVLPQVQSFISHEIQLSIFSDMKLILGLLGILLLIGCIAGAYPAYIISAFKPTQILKGISNKKSRSFFGLRNALVIFQFVISGILIVSTITVFNQLHYMKNKKLGMKKDHIITLNVLDEQIQKSYNNFFNELNSNPNILDVSASQSLPPGSSGSSNIDWDGKMDSDPSLMYGIRADSRFVYLYEIPITLGHNYAEKDYSSSKSYFLLNQSAVKELGWKNVLGRRFGWNDTGKDDGQVIGVVDDFHFFPLDRKIEPLAIELVGLHLTDWKARFFSIKISSQDITGTLSFIEKKWKQFSNYPIQIQFFDDRINSIYKAEQDLGKLFNLFAFIAVFIGCLGLYGLITFSIEQKIKEIGIRKVMGASVSQIVNLLSKEIVICILIANLIALPVAYYFMNKWLEDFAYRVDISWWVFVLSGGIALLIALVTVSFQAIKAAVANPIESLRYE